MSPPKDTTPATAKPPRPKRAHIQVRHLDGGDFIEGLRINADRSKNFHVRLRMAKLVRFIQRQMEEPFREKQDLIRVYGTKLNGVMTVMPSGMPVETAREWEKKIKAWGDQTIEVDFETDDGMLEIKLSGADLNAFPPGCFEVMMDYVRFVQDDKGSTDNRVEQLEKEVKRLQQELAGRDPKEK